MARISRVTDRGRYRISIQGPLGARDLGRLERICGKALEMRELPLDIELSATAAVDEVARLFLQRLAARGAVISYSRSSRGRNIPPH
jgi:hypothetical protein